jgi:hypothetical protein
MVEENGFRKSGILMLVVVITSLASGILAGIYGVELNAFDVETTLTNVGENSTEHIAGLIVEIVSSIATIALAGVLFNTFKSYNKGQALIGSLWLIASAIVLAVHNQWNLSLTWTAKDYALATGAQKIAIIETARSMLLTAKWGVTISATLLLLGIFTYSLILVSKLSKKVGRFGIVASLIGLIAAWIGWFNPGLQTLGFALFVPMILWEFTFGIWLIQKGD